MKKIKMLLVFLVGLFVGTAHSQVVSSSGEVSFLEVYKEALKINHGRFQDLDLIRPGDTLYLPVLPHLQCWKETEFGWEPRDVRRLNYVVGQDDYENLNSIWAISRRYHETYSEMRKGEYGQEWSLSIPIWVGLNTWVF
jgi:hypothetical protein